MVTAQIGTIALPIIVTPRINDAPVTVTQIKEIYSSEWVSDETTPMSFYLEYEDSTGTLQTILYNAGLSNDSQLVFDIPDAIYAALDTYSLLFFWLVVPNPQTDPATTLEKIYTTQTIPLVIADLHNTQ